MKRIHNFKVFVRGTFVAMSALKKIRKISSNPTKYLQAVNKMRDLVRQW